MKRKPLYVTAILLSITLIVSAFTALTSGGVSYERKSVKITASFYPVYIAALNVTQGVEAVELKCLSQPTTGCLHDYQLTPQDMVALEKTDLFIINGAGMEGYLDHVTASLPDLNVFDASAGIELLEGSWHHHHEGEEETQAHDEHDEDKEHEVNAHYWLDPQKYITEIENIAAALSQCDPAHAEQYAANAAQYAEKVKALIDDAAVFGSKSFVYNVITFNDSFDYLCAFLNLKIVHGVILEGETTLSAGETGEIIEEAKGNGVHLLIADSQYSLSVPEAVSAETSIPCLAVDACVKGADESDAYLLTMQKNLNALKEVLNIE